ncbi:MAG: hypothetical protein WA060_00940 [Minisyncoccia bacterium]
MKKNLQKILLGVSIILFVIFSLAFVFLFKKINDNYKETNQNTIAWMEEERKREDIVSLGQSLQEIIDDKTLLETHFAKSSDVVPFLDNIEKLAPKAGVQIEVDSVNIKNNNTGLVVGLKASGSFGAIYKFLTLLENSPYQLDFTSMHISKVQTGDTPGKNTKDSRWEGIFKIQLLSFIP